MKRLDAQEVGGRIRAARQAAGLTQSRLAERAGMEVQSLSRLERGEYEPSLSSAVALAEALGLALDTLVLGTPGAPAATPEPRQGAWRAVSGAREELQRTLLALQLAEAELQPRRPRAVPGKPPRRRGPDQAAAAPAAPSSRR
jgi:transcriptional regulator with XRE-family HTH domain